MSRELKRALLYRITMENCVELQRKMTTTANLVRELSVNISHPVSALEDLRVGRRFVAELTDSSDRKMATIVLETILSTTYTPQELAKAETELLLENLR